MTEFRLPELGEGVYEAELVRWLVQPNDTVKRGQALLEVMTDKATMEVPSPFAGRILSVNGEPGQQVKVGDPMLTYQGEGDSESTPAKARTTPQTAKPEKRPEVRPVAAVARASRLPAKASPSVRMMARKLGVDLESIAGSGPGGRVLIDDLTSRVFTGDGHRKAPEPRPDYGTPGERVKLVGLRRKIADQMVKSRQTIPDYAYVDECDVTSLVKLRELLKDGFSQHGAKLTYVPFILKAVALALREIPIVNSSLNDEAGEIVLHTTYHLGFAVATPNGLIVPVVRDCDTKNLGQIARDVERLSSEAKSGKIKLDDLRGGSFTVTSIGNIGGLISTPVINHPEVGIVGVGKVVKRPVYDAHGNLKPTDMLYLSFSFDHRVVDGAVGAAFGNTVIRHLQSPGLLLMKDMSV